jgi:hypothetical protein
MTGGLEMLISTDSNRMALGREEKDTCLAKSGLPGRHGRRHHGRPLRWK